MATDWLAALDITKRRALYFKLEHMRITQHHTSPDGQLSLQVAVGDDGETVVGFTGGEWHTHPDLLSQWLAVPEEQAVARFVELLKADALPVVLSTDGGKTTSPWVSDNLPGTLQYSGKENCILRYWSGKNIVWNDNVL